MAEGVAGRQEEADLRYGPHVQTELFKSLKVSLIIISDRSAFSNRLTVLRAMDMI